MTEVALRPPSQPAQVATEERGVTRGGLPGEAESKAQHIRKIHDLVNSIYWRVQDLRQAYAFQRSQGWYEQVQGHEPPINYKLDLLEKQAQELRDYFGI